MENKNVSEELSDWQHIDSPFSPISAKLTDEKDDSPVIKDDFYSESPVFPPGNHEDLPISNPEGDRQNLQEPEQNHTPGDDGVRRWKILRMGVVQTGIFRIVGRCRNYVNCGVGFWSFAWIAGGAAATVLVLFLRRRVLVWWQRRMQLGKGKESLMNLIREKDEKINQLLLQIAKMNEMLLARRRVPVIQVN
ncbi:hypothetical protein ACS0TY_009837 [Phlomoides rotata]